MNLLEAKKKIQGFANSAYNTMAENSSRAPDFQYYQGKYQAYLAVLSILKEVK